MTLLIVLLLAVPVSYFILVRLNAPIRRKYIAMFAVLFVILLAGAGVI